VIVGAAFCPHPPVLVPAVAAGAAAELDGLRAACDAAVGSLLAARPDVVVVLGSGPVAAAYPVDAAGSLAGFGVDVRAGGPAEAVLPLSLTVGAWLFDRAGYAGPRRYSCVPGQPDVGGGRVGLLVMGDGSACRNEKAPGSLDPRAGEYDAAVARALADGDVTALHALATDPVAADLQVAGAPAWATASELLADVSPRRTRLLADEAPYGVGYLVAVWSMDAEPESVSSTTEA
jgi:hypothetical protein